MVLLGQRQGFSDCNINKLSYHKENIWTNIFLISDKTSVFWYADFLILKSLEGKNLTCYEYFSISVLKHFGYTGIQKSSYTFTSNMVFNDYL